MLVAPTVTVIDGATNGTTNVTVGSSPYAVAVNPVTNKVYVANQSGGNVTVINVDGSQSVPLTATSALQPGDPLTVSATAPYIRATSPPPLQLRLPVPTADRASTAA